MEVRYKVGARNLLQTRIYLFGSSLVARIGLLIWLLFPFLVSGLLFHLLRGINPIAHPSAVLKHTGQFPLEGALIGWLVGSTIPYVFAAVSDEANSVSINSHGFTVATMSFSSKPMILWQSIKAVEEDARYIYLRKSWNALTIPKDAFFSSAEAEVFFDTALTYWRDAKEIVLHPTPDVSGVWPPAPRAGNARELGNKP